MTSADRRGRRPVSRRSFLKGTAVGAGLATMDLATLSELGRGAGDRISTENALAGTTDWFLPFVDESIEGFPSEYSVNAGETIDFKVNTVSNNYRIDVYRVGWYGGTGGRKVATFSPSVSLPQVQPAPIRDVDLGLVDCGNWAVSASWPVPANAVSGVYVAHLVRLDVAGEPSNWIFFVVRNDGVATDLLVQTSDTTYQAYNRWGGNSFYAGDGDAVWGRAVKVSYNRPMAASELENEFTYAELPLVRWLERNGYDVAYTSNVDTERRPAQLLLHKVFVSSGHDEYWSGGMRANVEAARDAGVHLVFMTGNEVFWKVRWEPSNDGTPYKTLVCYKETLNDAKIDPSPQWTGTWRDGRFSPPSDGGRPENGLTGTLFKAINPVDDADFAIEVPHAYAALRFWRNTSVAALAPGTKATLTDATLGYEWNTDGDLPARPTGLIRMSETTAIANQVLQDNGGRYVAGPLTHYLTMYRAASGALVWSTGTVQWSWGLDDFHTNRPDVAVPVDARIQQATLNALADMGVQPSTRQAGLVAATASTDTLPPVSTITSPAAGANVEIGSPVAVTGTATDAGGGRVAAVEVSVDGGTSWHPAIGRESWSYTFIPTALGPLTLKVRAVDDSCNIEPEDAGRQVTAVERSLPGSLWNGAVVPTVTSTDDDTALELGVRFRSAISAFATGISFYKGAGNNGQHVGRVWTSGGAPLASVVFTGETASGWQTAYFAQPVALDPGVTYVASYSAPNGRYASDPSYFEQPYQLHPLTAPANGDGGGNGVFSTTPGSFPSSTFGASNYWVDVVIDTDDALPPRVSSTDPAIDISQVSPTTTVSATFSESMDGPSIQFQLSGPAGIVAGSRTYDGPTRTLRFTPTAPLATSTSYVARVVAGSDTGGTPMVSPFTWSFTTAGPAGTVPTSLWTSGDLPVVASATDSLPIELGVKFGASVTGFISAIRFYKGPNNQGPHIGRLWTAAGDLLATVTFTAESATGWQEQAVAVPVNVVPGATYVVSYYAPQGGYAADAGYFASASRTRGPLTAPDGSSVGGNGVFRYGAGGGFPITANANTNYWVDVVFDRPPDLQPPSVVSSTPARDLQAVGVGELLSVTFDKVVDPASVVFTLDGPGGTTVPGTTGVDPANLVATFNPQTDLSVATTYVASVSATSGLGVAMTDPHRWTFTTATLAGRTPATLWDTSARPLLPAVDDAVPIELGVKFRSEVDGAVTGVRFYKGPGNAGPHVGHLWTAAGALLGTVAFANESAEGWQQANFASPVLVAAGQTYIASYHAPAGRYAATSGGFQTAVDRPPLHALADGVDGGNGVFAYGPGSFPNQSFGAGNYWVDLVFVDALGPAVASHFPVANAIEVERRSDISATFGEDVVPASVTMELRDARGSRVTTSAVAYDPDSRTATIRPIADLQIDAIHTATVVTATDTRGNPLGAPVSWSFRTISGTALSLFGTAIPALASAPERVPIEVGTKFSVSEPVDLLGLRFYRGPDNTGVHVGHLWRSNGNLLAEVTFASGGPNGWQFAALPTPLRLAAGSYVVSYLAPNGGYAATLAYFVGSDVVNGPLTAPTSASSNGNGVYRAGGGFPTDHNDATNYWVDVLVRRVSNGWLVDPIPTSGLEPATRLDSGSS